MSYERWSGLVLARVKIPAFVRFADRWIRRLRVLFRQVAPGSFDTGLTRETSAYRWRVVPRLGRRPEPEWASANDIVVGTPED